MPDIFLDIDRTFGNSRPEAARICCDIVDYLSMQEFDQRLHLTFTLLKNRTKPSADSELLLAIQYLTGAHAAILETKYEFVDDSGEYFPLSNVDILNATKVNGLVHPDNGTLISNYQSHVLVYFAPTLSALALSKGGA